MADADHTLALVSREDAKKAGLKRYFTGIPCNRGHSSERQTSNATCLACGAEKNLRAYYANHEMGLARLAEYRKANRRKIRASARIFYAANADKVKKASAAYFRANHAAELLKRKAYRVANRAATAARDEAYRLANIDQVNVVKRRYRARKRGASGNHTIAQIEAMLLQQGHRCVGCKASIRKGYHADHIVPLKLGGSNDISNIQLLCRSCNCSKGGKDPFVWAHGIGRLL